MSGSKSKSPPQGSSEADRSEAVRRRGGRRSSRTSSRGARSRRGKFGAGFKTSSELVDAGARVMESDYSVNALSKKLGRDRRTIDKAVAGIAPTRVVGKTKFYRLEDVEAAFREKSNSKLKDKKTLEEIRKLRIANDENEGLVVARVKVAEAFKRCLGQMVPALEQRLVSEYPTAVAGLDVPQARIYGRRLCDELVSYLQSLEREWKI